MSSKNRNNHGKNNEEKEKMIFHPCDTADIYRQVTPAQKHDHLWYYVHFRQQKAYKAPDDRSKPTNRDKSEDLLKSRERLYPLERKITLSKMQKETYERVIQRRREALALLSQYQRIKILHGKPTGKAFHGLGGAHVREASLTIHPVYGVPYLPGSSIKGVVRHWALEAFFQGNEKEYEAAQEEEAEETKKRYALVIRDIFGDQEHSGAVQFHDAFVYADFNRNEKVYLKPDVLTVHFKHYYEKCEPPTDDMDPIPNEFYGVEAPYFEFVITLAGQQPRGSTLTDEELLEVAGAWLQRALTEMGIGAKTTSGYGSFDFFKDKTEEILEKGLQIHEKRKAKEETLRREREEREKKEAWARKWAEMSEEERLLFEIRRLSKDKNEDREKSKSELFERVVAQAEQGDLEPARVLKKYWEETGDWKVKKKKKKQYEKVQILRQLLGES